MLIPMTVQALPTSKLEIIEIYIGRKTGDTLWEACNVDYATLFDRRYYETAETAIVSKPQKSPRQFSRAGSLRRADSTMRRAYVTSLQVAMHFTEHYTKIMNREILQ